MANLFSTGPGAGERGQNVASLLGNPQPQDLLTVHDINVSRQPRFQPGGGIVNDYVVRYFIGAHGPFVHEYDPSVYSPAQVQADIHAEGQSLAAITAPRPAPSSGGGVGPPQFSGCLCIPPGGGTAGPRLRYGGSDLGVFPDDASAIARAQSILSSYTFVPYSPNLHLQAGQFTVFNEGPIYPGGESRYSASFGQFSDQPIPSFFVAPSLG